MNIQDNFNKIVNAYLLAFMRKHGFFNEHTGEYSEYYWLGGDVGGVVGINGEYFITLSEIRYDINNGLDKSIFFKYFEHELTHEKIGYKEFVKRLENGDLQGG